MHCSCVFVLKFDTNARNGFYTHSLCLTQHPIDTIYCNLMQMQMQTQTQTQTHRDSVNEALVRNDKTVSMRKEFLYSVDKAN